MEKIKTIRIRLILIFGVMSFFIAGHAQRFLHITSSDGLPDNHARFFFQDKSGFIYVGTRIGLSRYDGYNFLIATMADSIRDLPKEFSSMIETNAGLFAVASSGIYRYNRTTNTLIQSKSLQLKDEACFIEYDNRIFCGTSAGLYEYTDQQWVNTNLLVSGIENIHVRTMLVNNKNELLLGTDKGIFRFGSNMVLLDSDIGNNQDYHDINCIAMDESGGCWISTYSNLYYRDSSFKIAENAPPLFSGKFIRTIELDFEGRIWVGGEFGIIIFDPEDNSTRELFRDIEHNQGLNDNAVYSLFRDRDNNMWVGTYFGGINLWNSSLDKFKTYFPGNTDFHLSGKVVREMQEDQYGNLWLALEDGGINYLDIKTGRVKKFFYEKENEYKNVHSLVLNGDKLWVGSFNAGLECFRIIFKNKNPLLIRTESFLNDKMIFAISMNEDHQIYIGAVDGIYRLNILTGDIEPYKEEVFKSRMIYTIKCISEDEILAGTLRNGLYYCNLNSDLITTFSSENKFSSMQNISSIKKVSKDEYAITSNSGLYLFSTIDNSLDCILSCEGIAEFRSVLADDEGIYWVSTTNGLSRYSINGELIKKYNTYDGLPENQFNFNSAFKTSKGLMFFGTYNGLISFDPIKLKSFKNRIPQVSFTNYTVVGDDRTTLQSLNIDNQQKELRLNSYQTFLTLEFSTLGYTQSKDLNYEIRISGKGGNWDQLLNNRSVTFTHLGKGWHKVEVRPVTDENVIIPSTELNIYRQPKIWQTGYAYAIYAGLFIMIFLYARKDFLRRQNEKNILALERYEKENQKLLNDQKMRFFLNISHEFRTPLTIIGGTISNILQKFNIEKEVERKLNTIQNTSNNLNKLVNDFLDYGKLESGFKPLEVKKKPVLQFIRITCSMFDNWAEVNQLVYKKNIPEEDVEGFFDPEKLERVIYNLLSNAFKFNSSNGMVEVDAGIEGEVDLRLNFRVRDTGIGIQKELVNEIKKHFRNDENASLSEKSIGLAYTAGLIRQMGGSIEIESEVEKGSVFTISIPLNKPAKDIFMNEIRPAEITEQNEELEFENESLKLIRDEKKPVVFIIDDNVDLLEMLKENLESDYIVSVASSPKEALSKIIQQEISLIICDIMMPEMNGFEVIESLQSNIQTSHIPILILTAAAEKNIELKAYMKGAVSYLAKPFNNEELRLKIDTLLSFRRELIKRFGNEHDIAFEEIVCSKKDEQFITRAAEVVNKNLSNIDFDVDMFCSEMNVSRTLLHNKLKSISGLSTTEFIRTIRLKHAYVLLKKDSGNVSETALKCGFNDSNYFSKCFKKKFGIHPSKLN
jgi:signal transduction histidine kinase/ligand-binding sensor domain-containing protein/DNA-binding response OmpR family regulator